VELLLAAIMRAPSKDSLLATWLTEDGCIEGLPHEAVADLHAYERWCVATKPAAQASVAVKNQVQQWKLYWLNANTVKGVRLVHTGRWSPSLHKRPVTLRRSCKKKHPHLSTQLSCRNRFRVVIAAEGLVMRTCMG
jgi:hypothetical protein